MSSENQINRGYLRSTLVLSFFILGEFDWLFCYKQRGERERESMRKESEIPFWQVQNPQKKIGG